MSDSIIPTTYDAISSRYAPRIHLFVPEVMEILGVSRSTVDNWRRAGKGPKFRRFEGRPACRIADLARWIDGRTTGQSGRPRKMADGK